MRLTFDLLLGSCRLKLSLILQALTSCSLRLRTSVPGIRLRPDVLQGEYLGMLEVNLPYLLWSGGSSLQDDLMMAHATMIKLRCH
jgi:hypothetical protein